MIRYRCTHCAATLAAHERRAGQSSVCKVCLRPHSIPADRTLWLHETSEGFQPPVAPSASVSATPPAAPPPDDRRETTVPGNPLDREFQPVHTLSQPNLEFLPPATAASSTFVPDMQQVRLEPDKGAEATDATTLPPPAPIHNQTAPLPASTTPTSAPPLEPVIARREPLRIQTQAEIAAAISSALATRMKPPKKARRDLRPSTAVWMLLTAFGVALVIAAVVTNEAARVPALILGTLQIVIGYAWIVHLTYLRRPIRGLLCIVPPLTFYYLAQSKYARFRPLRFVATGVVIVALAVAVPILALHMPFLTRNPEPTVVPAINPATLSKLERLRYYRDHRSYESLSELLRELARTDPERSADSKDRPQLAVELRELCKHVDMNVRVLAMAAYSKWDPVNARAVVLSALRSERQEEREMALRLLPLWKDAQSARAAAAMIGSPNRESTQAREALEEIGGAAAEQAAIGLLKDAHNFSTRLTALAILEKVGGPDTAVALRAYARTCDDQTVKNRALAVAELIEARQRCWLLRNARVY